MIREKEIERYLREQVEKHGGKAYKWVSPGNKGVPDRIVLLPGWPAVFVELKAPGRPLKTLQVIKRRELNSLGFMVKTIEWKEQVDELIRVYTG